MSVEISLKGKHALVTGGAGGMGRTISCTLAKAGANVIIADLDLEQAEKTAADIAQEYHVVTGACKCDVSIKADAEAAVEAVLKKLGRLDILNHVAGVCNKCDFLEITEENCDYMLSVNGKGALFVNQAALRAMIPNRSGKIVNMSSMSGKEGFPTNVAYSMSKFAVTGLTQGAAKYAAPYNINVNCVCPGIIRTPIWERLLDEVRDAGADAEAYWQERISSFPLKRAQTEEDIAMMFLYLSSSLADNMTGQAINVSGGLILS